MKLETKTHSTSLDPELQSKDSVSTTCQNCQKDFTIEPDDFSFYEKIKVPPPTFCPECRLTRRLVWRNMRSLYKRECGLCKKNLISCYKEDVCPVYCVECFNGDGWDQYAHAQELDHSRDFFSQIYNLFKLQPRVYQLRIGTIINGDYGNYVGNSKNSYMCFSSIDNEDVIYSENIDRSRDTLDSLSVADLEQCSWNIFSTKNYNSQFMLRTNSCIDSSFLYDCVNCQNCCLSSNLRNQQYIFRNKKLNKETYREALDGLHLETYSGFKKAENEFIDLYKNAIHKYAQIISSPNSTGDWILNSKNIFKSFNILDSSEDVRYCMRFVKGKDIFDCTYGVSGEFLYECTGVGSNSYNQLFSMLCFGSKDILYSISCRNCSDCFGCVGLKNAQYCILNKQYSKEEYFELLPKIIKHMTDMPYIDKMNRIYKYGEFFPFEFSPFGYNETIAIDIFPINKEKSITMGYNWKERGDRNYSGLVSSRDLPDSISDIQDLILSQVISCLNNGKQEFQCTNAFKIVSDELRFYREKKLPLPRYCPNCRHYQRLVYRNPMKLWHRKCMKDKCQNEFETSYAPDRPEIVYCEKCYQQEVY